jgi:diadenylate cyclase
VLENAYTSLVNLIKFIRIQDFLDILIVAYVIYQGIRLIRETRAIQLIKGILILLVVMQLSTWLNLHMVSYILQNAMQIGLIAIVVVFQPELRRALEQMGRSRFGNLFTFEDGTSPEAIQSMVDQICHTTSSLSQSKTGALIVLERQTKIGDIIRTGVSLNADVSGELLVNIFVPNTPLHDGAVVIRGNRIIAAACFLPLTQNSDLNLELGTRHRAALGMSETSDAVVVVVSEETGKVSLALDGSLTRNLSPQALNKALVKLLTPDQTAKPRKKFMLFRKGMKK